MKINVGISNRHVHLTKEDYYILFKDKELTKRNDLSQPGQFASNLTVTIKGQKGEISGVRVIGPLRDYTQVEVSKTDCRALGVEPCLALSGELENASEITIIGEYGEVTRKNAIVHNRHVHASFEDKEKYNLKDTCDIYIDGDKPTILKDVKIVYGNYNLELHLDTDDGNGCNLKTGDQVELK